MEERGVSQNFPSFQEGINWYPGRDELSPGVNTVSGDIPQGGWDLCSPHPQCKEDWVPAPASPMGEALSSSHIAHRLNGASSAPLCPSITSALLSEKPSAAAILRLEQSIPPARTFTIQPAQKLLSVSPRATPTPNDDPGLLKPHFSLMDS